MTDMHTPDTDPRESVPVDRSHLYAAPMAEEFWFTAEEAWARTEGDTIEVWSVHPPKYHLSSADMVLEAVAEWASEYGEIDEGMSESITSASADPEVISAMDAVLDLLTSKVTYRMADTIVGVRQRDDLGRPT